jgi:hypothetical protein
MSPTIAFFSQNGENGLMKIVLVSKGANFFGNAFLFV